MMCEEMLSRFNARLTGGRALLMCFSAGLILRLIPELLAFPHPISWDMVHYAYFMRGGVVWEHWSSFFTSTWLLYSLVFPVHSVFGVDSFLLLKIVGPLLFGLNVCGIYWFAHSLLGWSLKKSLLAGGFFSLQLAALRISSEFLRNTLGLGLLLFTLPLIKRLDSKWGLAGFVVLSLLTVFAHEYAAVTLLVVSLAVVFLGLISKNGEWKRVMWKRLVVAVLPALLVFVAGLYLRMFPVSYEGAPAVGPNLVWVGDEARQSYGKLFFFVNYLGMETAIDIYPNYLSLAFGVVGLFVLLYLSYLYLVWKGFFKNRVLDVWTGLLLLGSFGCLVSPFFALQYWHRWMFMLVYPFTFYAVNGGERLWSRLSEKRMSWKALARLGSKVSGMVLVTVLLVAMFLATPFLMVNVGFGIYSLCPICRYFCSSPTVPYQDVDGTVEAMEWLRVNMDNNSCTVLHNAFAAWAKLYLDVSHDVVAYKNDVDLAVEHAVQRGYQHVYFVCWNQPVGWYGVYLPEGFDELRSFCRISVYQYVGGNG